MLPRHLTERYKENNLIADPDVGTRERAPQKKDYERRNENAGLNSISFKPYTHLTRSEETDDIKREHRHLELAQC